MVKCNEYGYIIRSLTTFTFVVHKEHFPYMFPTNNDEYFYQDIDCLRNFSNYTSQDILKSGIVNKNYPYDYPSNFLRNVARKAAKTYYILSLDIDYLPPYHFVSPFLKMIRKLYIPDYKRT